MHAGFHELKSIQASFFCNYLFSKKTFSSGIVFRVELNYEFSANNTAKQTAELIHIFRQNGGRGWVRTFLQVSRVVVCCRSLSEFCFDSWQQDKRETTLIDGKAIAALVTTQGCIVFG